MPARLIIDLIKLEHNIATLRSLAPHSQVIPVLKANAYGHGAVALAAHLKKLQLPYIGFANLQEGLEVKESGYDHPILILGATEFTSILTGLRQGLTMSISSEEALAEINHAPSDISGKIHIKIDTGMNRAGVSASSYQQFLTKLQAVLHNKKLQLEAIYSHLACAEDKDNPMNQQQYEQLLELVKLTNDKLGVRVKFHLQNSAGIINFPHFKCDWIRPGLSVYGINPAQHVRANLKPILEWIAPIINVRRIENTETVSYGQSGRVKQASNIVTIAAGYADGFNRLGSNGKLQAIINNKICPTLGNVCMDMTMFQLADHVVEVGDEAVLIGSAGGLSIDVYDIAQKLGTIPNEVLTSLSKRNIRYYAS